MFRRHRPAVVPQATRPTPDGTSAPTSATTEPPPTAPTRVTRGVLGGVAHTLGALRADVATALQTERDQLDDQRAVRRPRERTREHEPAADDRPVSTARRRATRMQADWGNRVIAQGFLVLLALALWLANGCFTAAAFASWFGQPGWLVGVVFHLGLSKAEVYLWHRWTSPMYFGILILAVLFDAGTTLFGALPLLHQLAPALVGAVPTALGAWVSAIWGWLTTQTPPNWWSRGLVLLGVAVVLALSAERLLRRFWRDFCEVWNERYATA